MKFLLQTQIGIEKITELELEKKFHGLFSLDYSGYVPHKNGIVQLEWKSDKHLDFYKELQTIEDAFFVLDYIPNISQNDDLKSLYKRLDKDVTRKNLDYFFDTMNEFGPDRQFRFVTRKKAANDFRRIDLEHMLEDFFEKNIRRAEVTQEEGVKEIWSTLVKNRLLITVRLTTKEKRQGTYKTASVDGSLRPSIAHAMAFLADITAGSTVWDPFCGAGTIGAEVLDGFKCSKLLLSDISEEALAATKENLNNLTSFSKNKGKVSFRNEDFFVSPNYAEIIITNLPFGKKYEINDDFIHKFFEKITEVKKVKKLVILFPSIASEETWFPGENYNEHWQLTRKFSVQVLGYPAFIQVYQKSSQHLS